MRWSYAFEFQYAIIACGNAFSVTTIDHFRECHLTMFAARQNLSFGKMCRRVLDSGESQNHLKYRTIRNIGFGGIQSASQSVQVLNGNQHSFCKNGG